MTGIIYKATNIANNKSYIGQTKNSLKTRKRQHIYNMKNKKAKTIFVYALLKYGVDNFEWNIIDKANTQDELSEKEKFWIKFFETNVKNKGYNMTEGGDVPPHHKGEDALNTNLTNNTVKQIKLLLKQTCMTCGEIAIIFNSKENIVKGISSEASWIHIAIDNNDVLDEKYYKYIEEHPKDKYVVFGFNMHTGIKVGEWNTLEQCSIDLSIDKPNLHYCLNDKINYCYGYIFIYKYLYTEQYLKEKINKAEKILKLNQQVPFLVFDFKGNLLHTDISQGNCAKKFNISQGSISLCLNEKSFSCKGKVFIYEKLYSEVILKEKIKNALSHTPMIYR